MNRILLSSIIVILMTFISCESQNDADQSSSTSESDTQVEVQETVELKDNPDFLSVQKWDSLRGDYDAYYIVNYAGVAEEQEAIAKVDSLKTKFPNAGYLWIPDYQSLSGKEMYAVFLDQSKYEFSVMESMQKWKTENKGIYVVKVAQSEERWVAYSPIDVRVNGEKQKIILTYATPDDEDAYVEEGGEDWGWFVNDVGEFFANHFPEVIMESTFYSGLLPEEIEKLEAELSPEGFCYIFIDGKNKTIVGHDTPDVVIMAACSFFGFPEPTDEY